MEDRLQKFAKLVDVGSFTKAAEGLHISQPALSAAMNKLERELHTTLLLRGTRPLKLTPNGEAAYAHAKEIAVRTGNLKLHIAQAAKQRQAVRIGMIDSLANALFEQGTGLAELEQQASVSLVVDNSRYLTGAIARDDIDMAFVVGSPQQSNNIHAELIGSEPLVLVCRRELLAATKQALVHGNLPNFISYDQNSTTFRLIHQTLVKQHVTFRPTFYSTSPEVIRKLVVAGKGTAALPYLMVRGLVDQKLLTPVDIAGSPVIARPIQAIKHRDKTLPDPLSETINQLADILQNLTAEADLQF